MGLFFLFIADNGAKLTSVVVPGPTVAAVISTSVATMGTTPVTASVPVLVIRKLGLGRALGVGNSAWASGGDLFSWVCRDSDGQDKDKKDGQLNRKEHFF